MMSIIQKRFLQALKITSWIVLALFLMHSAGIIPIWTGSHDACKLVLTRRQLKVVSLRNITVYHDPFFFLLFKAIFFILI